MDKSELNLNPTDPTPTAASEGHLPMGLVKKLIALSLIFGLVGGAAGSYLFVHYSPQGIQTTKQQLTLQENSAVIDVIKKVSPSVVSVNVTTSTPSFFGTVQQQGAGTGIILTADGLIMTNKHVASDTNGVYTVVTSDGKTYNNAKLVAQDPSNDVAFLRISASGLTPAAIGDSSQLLIGQHVVAIGNALGQFQNTATEGIVSGFGRSIVAGGGSEPAEQLQDLIQTDAAINPGNSGGPLVNLAGQVVGMNTAIAGSAQNIGFAIPTAELAGVIDSVKTQGKIVRPYLGVRYVPITPDFAQSQGLKVNEGAYVSGGQGGQAVVPGSPADKAGVKDGDIITKVAGEKIDSQHSLSALVGKHKVGEKIQITIIRNGKEQTLDITLEQASA